MVSKSERNLRTPEFFSELPVNRGMRSVLKGLKSPLSRETQLGLATLSAEKFDFNILKPLDLVVNERVLSELDKNQKNEVSQALTEISQLTPQFTDTEVQFALKDAQNASRGEAPIFRFPENKAYLRLVNAVLVLFVLMVVSFSSAYAEAPENNEARVAQEDAPEPEEEDTATQTPEPTNEAGLPTVTPTSALPTVTPTPPKVVELPTVTPTVEATPTPESVVKNYAIISVAIANLREAPKINSEVITTANAGDAFELTGVIDGEWHQIKFKPDRTRLDENGEPTFTEAWLHGSVFEPELRQEEVGGKGGVEPQVTASEPEVSNNSEITGTETITPTDTVTESMSKSEESMRQTLPADFEKFYQDQNGTVEWNAEHGLFQVTMPVGTETRTFLLFPQTSAEKVSADTDPANNRVDLENALYYFGEKSTVSHTFTKENGEKITQTFHFGVSPKLFPGTDTNLWDEDFKPNDAKVVIGDKFLENSAQTVELFRTMLGLPQDESFELYFILSGQDIKDFNPNVDIRTSRERQGFLRGGNDFKSLFLDLGIIGDNTGTNKFVAAYFTAVDLFGKNYLVDTEDLERGKKLFGAALMYNAMDRMMPPSATALGDREDARKFESLEYTDNFVIEQLETLYALEKQYGQFGLEVQIPKETLDNYIPTIE